MGRVPQRLRCVTHLESLARPSPSGQASSSLGSTQFAPYYRPQGTPSALPSTGEESRRPGKNPSALAGTRKALLPYKNHP